jgi:hypothetical protein
MAWNNNPTSYTIGSQRLVNPADSTYFTGAASGALCKAGGAPDATEYSKGESFYQLAPANTSGQPPTSPPTVPALGSAPTQNTINVYVNGGFTGGNPRPVISFLYGTTPNPTTPFPAQNAFGSLFTGQFTGLTAGTTYYFKSVATNASGQQVSAAASYSTSSGGGVAPSPAPTVPAVSGTPTGSSITVQFDVAGVGGTPAPTFGVLIGRTQTPTIFIAAALVSGTTYRATAVGLTAGTTFFFQSVAQNGVSPNAVSATSAGISTGPAPPTETLRSLCHQTFLVPIAPFIYQYNPTPPPASQGGNAPINAALTWLLSSDAPNGAADQTYGDFYCRSFIDPTQYPYTLSPAPTQFNTTGGCYNNNGDDYSAVSNTYLNSINSQPNTKLIVSLGGFYADLLGMFGPYVVPGAVAGWVTPTSVNLIDSIAHVFYNNTSAPNPMGWARSGATGPPASTWGAQTWDGLNLDFENIGLGGRLITNNAWGDTQWPPALTADRAFVPSPSATIGASPTLYSTYITAIKDMIVHHGTAYPDKILTSAPISLSINGTTNTNITCTQNAFGTWFAFPTKTTPATLANFNTAPSDAMNHPSVLSYFDDIFIQFYNEAEDEYLGGANFVNLVQQWAVTVLEAQKLGRKNVRVNIGLGLGLVANITSPNPPPPPGFPTPGYGNAGPTAAWKQGNAPAGFFEYWYPQFATASPPNPTPADFPNISVSGDPTTLSQTLSTVTQNLQADYPGVTTASWCSGAGFFAGFPATEMCKNVYTQSSQYYVPGLPTGNTYLWADAFFPSPDPGWKNNVPIVPS